MKAKVWFGLGAGGLLLLVLWRGGQRTEPQGRPLAPQPQSPASSAAVVSPDKVPTPQRAAGTETALAPAPAELWEQPIPELEFAAFVDWTRRYGQAATPAARAALEAEGIRLARARLTALANLIVTQPARALELVVPEAVRRGLPESVQALLEEPINTRADYRVVCVLPPEGQQSSLWPLIRWVEIDGQNWRVFTFGKGLEYVTRNGVPINGIAVPAQAATVPVPDPIGLNPARLLALHPNPAQRLDAAEAERLAPGAALAVRLGGQVHSFDSVAEAEAWAQDQTAAASLDMPENPPTAQSPYTEGRKRFLVLRVDFPDYEVDVFPTNNAVQHLVDLSNFMAQVSYGRHVIAPVGQGSDITPVMRMSQPTTYYENAGLSRLYPEAREVARDVYGYNLDQYDFCFVCTGSKPSYSYAGLGYVGGVGYHLANGYFDVRTSAHEFGHNLGLGHANWWDTGGRSTIGPGTAEEYGDPFDTMGGSGGGNRHFSASFKARLGWIPASDTLTVTTSGVYRLHAHDIPSAPIGLRAIRLDRASGDPYWIELRQLWTDRKAMMNGINFRWAAGTSVLLDMTPGSAGGKDDHSLVIGRTFSDWSRHYHITPLRKAHTWPESIDVAIYIGPFPTNQPPTVLVEASMPNPAVAQSVTFWAKAADPNGDQLAYAWDFGDGDYSVDNSPTVTHSFSSADNYYVQVTVSDLKGGTARAGLVVTVGNPSTYSISGRVLDPSGRGLAGMRVFTSSSRAAYTASDGSYIISRLAAGSYTVQAVDPVADAYVFVQPFFSNPVALGPDFVGADFVGTTNPAALYVTVVPKNSAWKYLDTGADPGTNWTRLDYDDSSWLVGNGVLGYTDGNDVIDTVIRYGPDPNNKYIAYYFRKAVLLTNLAELAGFRMEVKRDDGVVVYVNGTEVWRDNMPSGPITPQTLASSTVEPDSYLIVDLDRSRFVQGTNLLAAEVHQANRTSSDVAFDLALSGVPVSSAGNLTVVYISSPPPDTRFNRPTNVVIDAFARSGAGAIERVNFYANGVLLGQDTSAPYEYVWTDPAEGVHTLHVVAVVNGSSVTSSPVRIRVTAPVPPALAQTIIASNAVWKYLAGPEPAPGGWAEPGFDDASWPSGPAQLGFGDGDEATVIPGGPSNNRYVTVYFRHRFFVSDPAAVTNLTLWLRRDDGAAVYLNGVEVVRDNLPAGPISYSTLASIATDDGSLWLSFPLPPDRLAVGPNVVAAEVHQSSLTSSDLSFELALEALLATNRPRGIWLTLPSAGTVVSLPGRLVLRAEVVAGGTLGIQQVQFFADGSLMGQCAQHPYVWEWTQPTPGAHELVAVATDTAGLSLTSAPVQVTVTAPPLGTALISFGEVWKYLDTGSDPGPAWTQRTFDDRTWKAGPARLGYGGDGEVTTVSYGGNPNARHITTWFRRSFVVPSPAVFGSLLLRVIRDDGVAVYLNGREIFRDNLPTGPLAFNSLALAAVSGRDETTPLDHLLPATGLLAGTNVLAVEMHQDAPTSSDLGFDLALIGLTATNPPPGIYLSSPPAQARFTTPASVPLEAFVSGVADVVRVEFFADAVKLGQASSSPYSWTWTNPAPGQYELRAQAILASDDVLVSPGVTITVSNRPSPIQPVVATLIPAQSVWKYWDDVNPVPLDWTSTNFDDSAWRSGQARFGWGLDGELTRLTEGRITHYFRRSFTVPNPGTLAELVFQLVRDDGAVVYLNGREVFRSNMPTGPVTASTLASGTVDTPDETTWFFTTVATAGSGLRSGTNVVAVELHQASATSSDAGFDLQLVSYGTTEPRVYLGSPAAGAPLPASAPVLLEAFAWPPAGATVRCIEFFADGIKLGESTSAPYQCLWHWPTYGPHELTARLIASSGAVLDSAPVSILIARQQVTTTLIPSNSVWKYLDDGSDQGTNWAQAAYSDASWASGPARLGYGGDGEVTVVSYGPNPNNKYITTYFRRTFEVPSGVVYTNLTFRLVRDDGAVVWLDGREVFRSNMPTGPIHYRTLASSAVGGAAEQTFYVTEVAVTNFAPGPHLVAVEVHQSSASSSDLGFNLELTATGYVDDGPPPRLSIVVADGMIELSWPEPAVGWQLYAAPELLGPSTQWTPLLEPPLLVGGRRVVTVMPSGSARFFRLGKP